MEKVPINDDWDKKYGKDYSCRDNRSLWPDQFVVGPVTSLIVRSQTIPINVNC